MNQITIDGQLYQRVEAQAASAPAEETWAQVRERFASPSAAPTPAPAHHINYPAYASDPAFVPTVAPISPYMPSAATVPASAPAPARAPAPAIANTMHDAVEPCEVSMGEKTMHGRTFTMVLPERWPQSVTRPAMERIKKKSASYMDLLVTGVQIHELVSQHGWTHTHFKAAGALHVSQYEALGWTPEYMSIQGKFPLGEMIEVGVTREYLDKYDFTAAKLAVLKPTAEALCRAGYVARDLVERDLNIEAIRAFNFSLAEWTRPTKGMCLTLQDLVDAQLTQADIETLSWMPRVLATKLNVPIEELCRAMFIEAETLKKPARWPFTRRKEAYDAYDL